jgi:formamidopyrimidine-DNA glycosylase
MPEIPFIETLIANLAPRVTGRTVRAIQVRSPSVLKSVDPPLSTARGESMETLRRRGKLLLFGLTGSLVLIVHLKRDGRLTLTPSRQRPTRDVAVGLALDDEMDLRLIEIGPKKRAGLWLRRAGEVEATEPVAGLGVEPLSEAFTLEALSTMLDQAGMQLKRFLDTQRYLAGVGNAYGDEILWEARLSPFAGAQTLGRQERARLFEAIREVLVRSVQEHRQHFGDDLPMREPPALLRVHRKAGQPCPRCGTQVAAVYYSERETSYCPTCQTRGKVYADRRLSRLLR